MMVALAGEPGALSADARTAIAIATKAVRKATDNPSRPADAGGLAILYAVDLLDALKSMRAAVVRFEDDDDLNDAKAKADALIAVAQKKGE